MKNFKNLLIWQKGMNIVRLTYKLTASFPSSEKYCLTGQCQRSAISIPSNIAEGSSRNGKKDQLRFMEIALGSLFELETQVEVARMLEYSSDDLITNLVSEIDDEQKMLFSFIEKLKY